MGCLIRGGGQFNGWPDPRLGLFTFDLQRHRIDFCPDQPLGHHELRDLFVLAGWRPGEPGLHSVHFHKRRLQLQHDSGHQRNAQCQWSPDLLEGGAFDRRLHQECDSCALRLSDHAKQRGGLPGTRGAGNKQSRGHPRGPGLRDEPAARAGGRATTAFCAFSDPDRRACSCCSVV